jgi:starch synthase
MFIWKWMARRSNRIVAISHFIKNQISSTVQSATARTTVIHNIAPSRHGTLDIEKIEQLKELKKPFQLVYVGQITSNKGVPELLRALLELDDGRIGCWIVGGSQHTKKEEEILQSTVKSSKSRTTIDWIGYQPDPRAYYAVADWHIAPSKYEEPLGNVVQEAQSLGIPSIVSPNGGLPETLEDGKSGLILESVTPEAIKSCIKRASQLNLSEYQQAAKQYSETKNNPTSFEQAWVKALS